jgi:precorrin-3B synthase
MQTGDGLLVRLSVSGIDIGLDQASGLGAAARRHGNGIIEVTARGNIQVRGLSPASTGPFADAIAALDLDTGDGVAILTDPLAGLAPPPAVDGREIAAGLRRALAAAPFAACLGPKVSVVIDGGAALHLDAVAADIRLRADGTRWHVAVAGAADGARELGRVGAVDVIEAILHLLRAIAQHGPSARARDLPADPIAGGQIAARPRAETIGTHTLQDQTLALGVGLAFGHTDAVALAQLIDAARAAGTKALRTAPARALLFIGLAEDAARSLAVAAAHLGFITQTDDPRGHVAACAGAPICASAAIPTRALAPLVSAAAAPLLDGSLTIHLSGCRKGCAHPTRTALAIVGSGRGCELVIDGTANDASRAVTTAEELPAALQRIATAIAESRIGTAAERLERFSAARIAQLFGSAHHG